MANCCENKNLFEDEVECPNVLAGAKELLLGQYKLNSARLFRRTKDVVGLELKNNQKNALSAIYLYASSVADSLQSSEPDMVFMCKLLSFVLEGVSSSPSDLPKLILKIVSNLNFNALSTQLGLKNEIYLDLLFREFQDSPPSGIYLPVLSTGCSFQALNSGIVKFDPVSGLKLLLEVCFQNKKVIQTECVAHCAGLLNHCITEESFISTFMPSVHRFVLRSPETSVSTINTILRQLTLNADKFGLEFVRPFTNNILSLNKNVRRACSEVFLAVAALCRNCDVVVQIFQELVQKLCGPDGKKANMDSKLIVLETLGNLSSCIDNDSAFPAIITSLMDIFNSEVNDEMAESILNQLRQWMRHSKCSLSDKVQTQFKDRLTDTRIVSRVKLAVLQCLSQAHRSGVKISKSFLPLLLKMVQSAKGEVPVSPKVSEAVAAACLWVQLSASPGKVPDNIWDVLSGMKVDSSTSLPVWLSDRFLLSANDQVLSCLVYIIHYLLANQPTNLSPENKRSFYRTLFLIWLQTCSKSVLADVRCCIVLRLVAGRDPSQIIALELLRSLSALVDAASSTDGVSGTADVLTVALKDSKFGSRLVKLVDLVSRCSIPGQAPPSEIYVSSCFMPPVLAYTADPPTIAERLSVLFAGMHGLSHPAAALFNNGSWKRLCANLGLPDCAEAPFLRRHFVEPEIVALWSELTEFFVQLPNLNSTHRITLSRLLEWSPVTFGSNLVRVLHRDLLKGEYLSVTLDEVGIMRTPVGKLYNQELLDSLPRYQANKANVKRENKTYSHELQMDIMEAQERKKQAEFNKEETFLQQIALQLTSKQLETVTSEMEREAKIRERMRIIYKASIHMSELLTLLTKSLFEHQCSELQLDFAKENSELLSELILRLVSSPLMSPLVFLANRHFIHLLVALATSDRLSSRRVAVSVATWVLRVHRPVRLLAPASHTPFLTPSEFDSSEFVSVSVDWVAHCKLHSIQEETTKLLNLLNDEIPKATVASAVLLSTLLPIFGEMLLLSSFGAFDDSGEAKEPSSPEDLTWVSVSTWMRCCEAIKRQLCCQDSESLAHGDEITNTSGLNSAIDSVLCSVLPFKQIYELVISILEKDALAREAEALSGDCEHLERGSDASLPMVGLELLLQTAHLQVAYLQNSLSDDDICIQSTPLAYSLMERLISATTIGRSSALTCMCILANFLPIIFTHNLCPVPQPVMEEAKEEIDDGDDVNVEEALLTGTQQTALGNNSVKSGKNKSQKKKRKKAALAAASSRVFGSKMDSSISDPTTWPKLNLIANSQLRLFVCRCDLSTEIAVDADCLWRTLGFSSLCEKLVLPNRTVLVDRPQNGDLLLPLAMSTRLLLEATHVQTDVQKAAALALRRCLGGKSQDDIDYIFEYWLEIYHCLLEKPAADAKDVRGKSREPEPPKYRFQRIGLTRALASIVSCSKIAGYVVNGINRSGTVATNETAMIESDVVEKQSTKAGPWLQRFFKFLVDEGLHDRDEEVRYGMLQAGLSASKAHGVTNLEQLLPILESFLNKAPNVAELDTVRQAVVILLGSLAEYLNPEDQRVRTIFARLLSIVNFPADVVQKAVEDCLSPLASKLSTEQLQKTFLRLMSTLLSSSGYAERRGAAYALAGVVRGCGLIVLKQHGIVDKLLAAITDKTAKHRESALFAFERLSLCLGKLFEPYIVRLIPGLLDCFGDSNAGVREAAAVTSQAVMSRLSAHGIKLILPLLLKVIDEDSAWRTRCQAVNVLATMTSCAPKQLSSCLPQIVPRLLDVLIDSQEGVKKAGSNALLRIGTVIRNPEVQALVPLLIVNLQDPLTDKMSCLLALRDTCFTHVIDAACLALIMPVLQRAFDDRSTEIRKIASQIFGTLYSLARKEDLEPYIGRILPGLRGCLLDPVPEVRSVTARALGAMVRGVGESCSKELLPWLMSTLTSEQSSVDRSGAAQGLAEVLGGMGVQRLQSILPDFVKTAESTTIQPFVRDGYLMLFIYLPEVFSSEFSGFIHQILSPILKALADECEYLRDTALRAGQRIIDLFADKAVQLLLPELEVGLMDPDWRIRHSSLQLTGDLLYKLSGATGKGTTTTANEDDTFGTNVANRKILENLGLDRRNRVLARLHIARSDPTIVVRQAASHIWKIVVENTPRTLRELMPVLVQLLITSLGSPIREQQQVAGRALGDLVRKLGDRVLPEVIPYLEGGLNAEDGDKRRGVCNGLIEIMRNSSPEQIASFADRLTSPIRRSLTDSSAEVRRAGARAFDLLYAGIGLRALDDILPDLFAQLDSTGDASTYAMDGVRQLLSLRGKAVMPYLVPKLTQPQLDMKTFAFLAPIAGDALSRHLARILPAFILFARDIPVTEVDSKDLKNCGIVLSSISESSGVRTILQEFVQGISVNEFSTTPPGFRQGSWEYCYAVLRLLHIYLNICCVTSDAEVMLVTSQAPTKVHSTQKSASKHLVKSSDDDVDGDEEGSSEDEDDDSYDDNDDEAESEDEYGYSDEDEERPDVRQVFRRLLPDFYPSLLRNLSRLLTISDDRILTFTWACLDDLLKFWSQDDISAQVYELRQAIKSASSEFQRSQPQLRRATKSSQQDALLLPGFTSTKLPLQSLVRFYSDCILRGRHDIKEPAAQGLSECVALSSGPALQSCVIKILGPMIRLLGERQPSSVRIAVVESLATLIDKCPASTRPFTPQLQATFTKALGDPNKQIRLLGGRGIANIASLTPKVDSLLTDLTMAVTSKLGSNSSNVPTVGPYVQALSSAGIYTDTSLHALRQALTKSLGRPKVSTLKVIIAHLQPVTTMDTLPNMKPVRAGIDDDDITDFEPISATFVRKSAGACIGVALASVHAYICRLRDGPKLPTDESCQFSDFLDLVPWMTKDYSFNQLARQVTATELLAMLKVRPNSLLMDEALTSELYARSLRMVSDNCLCNESSASIEGFRTLGYWLAAGIELKLATDELASLVQLLSRGFKLDSPEHRVFAARVAGFIAWRVDLRGARESVGRDNAKWLSSFISILVTGTRDKYSSVCAASEEALAILCRIDAGSSRDETYKLCLDCMELAKKTALEETVNRLRKQNWSSVWQKGCLDIDDSEI